MKSKIIGTINLSEEFLAGELERIMHLGQGDQYSEFTIGTWRSVVLWNGSGEQHDTVFRNYDGRRRPTPLGSELRYINSIIEETFRTERLRWVRAFIVQNGALLPHRDFIEFEKSFIRINIPLRTSMACLHSQDDWVFHMRPGEIWYLDARAVHAACSLSNFTRVSLCLDFDCTDLSSPALINNPAPPEKLPAPLLIERDELEPEYLETLYSLGRIVNQHNLKDILQLLAKIHFYKRAAPASVYDWLIEIARRSGDMSLMKKTLAFKKFCIEERAVGERFEL